MIKLFLDLDGVLVNFSQGVKDLTGSWPKETSISQMWKAVIGVGDFYAKLDWMQDGRKLWDTLISAEPTILTGIPLGNYGWINQKYRWITKNLSPVPPVIIKHPGVDKFQAACAALGVSSIPENEVWMLIDDTPRMGNAWTKGGGIFILHKNTEDTLEQLERELEKFD